MIIHNSQSIFHIYRCCLRCIRIGVFREDPLLPHFSCYMESSQSQNLLSQFLLAIYGLFDSIITFILEILHKQYDEAREIHKRYVSFPIQCNLERASPLSV